MTNTQSNGGSLDDEAPAVENSQQSRAKGLLLGALSAVEAVLRSSITAAIVSVAAIVAGGWVSLYASEIRSGLPSVFGFLGRPPSPAETFIWLLVGFAVLFALRQWAVRRRRRREQGELLDESARLRNLVSTLPPEGFLGLYMELYGGSDRLKAQDLGPLLGAKTEEEIKANIRKLRDDIDSIPELEGSLKDTIRSVLSGLVTLAKRFDNAPDDITYASNIFLFQRFAEGEDPGEFGNLQNFLPEDSTPDLDGVLELQLDLSTSTAMGEREPDSELEPLSLPVPENTKSENGKWRVLPGAAKALKTGEADNYKDSRTLGDWCRENGDFRDRVCRQLDRYFAEGPGLQARSFASIPLKRWGDDQLTYGVISIHRDEVGILSEEKALTRFLPLVVPFRSMLVELLEGLDVLRNDEQRFA